MLSYLNNFKNPRVLFALFYDFTAAAICFWFAFILRYEIADLPISDFKNIELLFMVNQGALTFSFLANGLYRGVWRFSSLHDLARVIKATFFGLLLSIVLAYFVFRISATPRSIFVIQFFVLVVGLGGGRFLYRYLKDQTNARKILGGHNINVQNVLIVGGGQAGEKLLRDILANPSLNFKVSGLIDDDLYKRGALIHNVRVIGAAQDIPRLAKENDVKKIFIAIPSATNDQIKKIIELCKDLEAEVKILPKLDHLVSNEVGIDLLRNIRIEDLLGREQVQLDTNNLNEMINDRVLLITGAGGSIGSEISRQVSKFNPKTIILADYCELFVYELELEFREKFPNLTVIPKIVDVRDAVKIDKLFLEFEPEIVFHAAAYKHVPLMEQNPKEAIDTNVIGTMNVATAAKKYKAKKFVMVSTDKAVNPTNIMGASKRIAEMVITDFSNNSDYTHFISVRFGNVLGSNGSVIPLFRKLIDERKDITVTHPDMTRYFMSIPEASQLVIQSAALGNGGEIFVLEMGQPVKIVDLAKEMIKLAKLEIGKDINIIYTGLREGEKLYEELFGEGEDSVKTSNEKINISNQRKLPGDFQDSLKSLINNEHTDKQTILNLIVKLVPELKHYELVATKEENPLQ